MISPFIFIFCFRLHRSLGRRGPLMTLHDDLTAVVIKTHKRGSLGRGPARILARLRYIFEVSVKALGTL